MLSLLRKQVNIQGAFKETTAGTEEVAYRLRDISMDLKYYVWMNGLYPSEVQRPRRMQFATHRLQKCTFAGTVKKDTVLCRASWYDAVLEAEGRGQIWAYYRRLRAVWECWNNRKTWSSSERRLFTYHHMPGSQLETRNGHGFRPYTWAYSRVKLLNVTIS